MASAEYRSAGFLAFAAYTSIADKMMNLIFEHI